MIKIKCCEYAISGLYYKHVTIVNDDSSVVSKWSVKLIDDPRVIIYDHHRFIIQATGLFVIDEEKKFYNIDPGHNDDTNYSTSDDEVTNP